MMQSLFNIMHSLLLYLILHFLSFDPFSFSLAKNPSRPFSLQVVPLSIV